MLSRADSDSRWISATLVKGLCFKTCSIHGYKKKSRKERGQVSREGGGHHSHFVFSQKLLDAQGCVGGGIVMVQEPIPLCHFSGWLRRVSRTIFSTYSSKTSDLLCVLEKQTPCTLSHQYKKRKRKKERKKSTSSWNWSELATQFLVWANLVTSTDLTAAPTQGRSRSTNSHHLLLLWETEGYFWALRVNHGKSRILQQPVSSSNLPWKCVDMNSMTYLLTYLLTPWSRVLLEKLTSKLCS